MLQNRSFKIKAADVILALKNSGCLVSQTLSQNFFADEELLIEVDSRKAKNGMLFIAYRGINVDSHDYIRDILLRGGRYLVVERCAKELKLPKEVCNEVSVFEVSDGRKAWGALVEFAAAIIYKKIKFIGITGTNGKTSVLWALSSMLVVQGVAVLSIGTLGCYLGNKLISKLQHTTPDPPQLFTLLLYAQEHEVKYVIMEVSSHSLANEKLAGLKFDVAVWTSFTQDHLDFHGTMERYWQSKNKLFTEHLKPQATMLICENVANANLVISSSIYGKAYIYGVGSNHDVILNGVEKVVIKGVLGEKEKPNQVTIAMNEKRVALGVLDSYLGDYNRENFLAAFIIFNCLQGEFFSPALWSQIRTAPGRMETISFQERSIIIDFAHTPDGLRQLLTAVKNLAPGKISLVFGCGGDRDREKRSKMGAVAAKMSDQLIITSDNPRSEDPEAIIAEIVSGVEDLKKPCVVIVDRKKAIEYAVAAATINETIIIAGKGHEKFQILKNETIPFSDYDVAMMAVHKKQKQITR